ncbi:hypothetical protein BBD41_03270 [Paenibacillus ihbetae]|uniref:Uncharacterized protein n=1 Tax=Paenibacillus ihbetae TaxID=1870820 RepID=A0A1B2DVD0_9BACL|nr:hypothetical protein [Paenibacillus ihbetae]ANY71680.1 hypothetical protein BBD41_03270 [Paenibacillus ihbetae]
MELTITEEQVAAIVEKEIIERIDKNLTLLLKKKYMNYQYLGEIFERTLENVLEKRLTQMFSDKQIKELVTSENVSKVLAEKLIKTVSEDLVDRLLEGR